MRLIGANDDMPLRVHVEVPRPPALDVVHIAGGFDVPRLRHQPIARFMKLRKAMVQHTANSKTKAPSTIGRDKCGTSGVSEPRIPSETYTIGFSNTAYLIQGTASSPRQG